ncbi:SDR family oxidoreductase [[Pseudomonas] carboxydohydrogena]|uniref:SDR family oxidoreductase n=1 Tax=Afipia carboxydohydrogena TaxID=290 RepID=A0ABY8BUW3_AFICR|nr:SDR family oxidoreductase [[Pseudomonas] carboxydohydrogena]WEF52746.1 SDR family oxidoreductase [[Pseudomonas] carboxydohydrogena]
MSHTKIALVTGASSGIGKASALALVKAGFTVVMTARRKDKLDEAAAEGTKFGKCLAVTCDMTDPQSIAALFATVKEKFGRLDLLFNNAGVGVPAVPLEDLPFENWKTALDTNLTAPFLCTQHAFRIMKEQTPRGGRIINNGSISAHSPRPFTVAYTSTKHAITGLTKSIALDGRAYDIAGGQIDIGNAVTDFTTRMAGGILQPNGQTMVEPRMDVQNVADAIVFMATRTLEANVLFLNVMATKMPFVGRG